MKRVTFSILAILLVALGITAIVSCEKEEINPILKENSLKEKNKLSADKIAKYHNIAVDLFEKAELKNKSKKDLTILEIQDIVTKELKDKYPDLMKNYSVPQKGNFLSQKYIVESETDIDFDYYSFLNDALNYLISERIISESFAKNIKEINLSDFSFSEIKDKINDLKENNKLSENEKQFLEVYEKVLDASHDYWTSKNMKLKPSSDVMAADAVAAVLGSFVDGIFSIIQGAVVSIAVNEDADDNGCDGCNGHGASGSW